MNMHVIPQEKNDLAPASLRSNPWNCHARLQRQWSIQEEGLTLKAAFFLFPEGSVLWNVEAQSAQLPTRGIQQASLTLFKVLFPQNTCVWSIT